MRKITSALFAGALIAGAGALCLAPPSALARGGAPVQVNQGPPPPSSVTKDGKLLEAISSSFYPIVKSWAAQYQRIHSDVKIAANQQESEAGISAVAQGQVHIGTSEAYMSDAQIAQGKLLNIPLAVGAEEIVYNLPEISGQHLHLSGTLLAAIYSGTLRYWDDAKIKQLNPSLPLPHQKIISIRTADGSGDTFVFTQYLASTGASWQAGFGTTITWPSAPGAVSANGSEAAFKACKAKAHSIAYVNFSMDKQLAQSDLGVAALQNPIGNFVLPTLKSITAAASTFDHETPTDGRIALVQAPGNDSYPIVTYEYAIVNPRQPDDATAEAVKNFLSWAIAGNGGSDTRYLNATTHFTPLPKDVVKISQAQIDQIQSQ